MAKLGLAAKLYFGATEITNVKDLSLNIEKAEADATTRASGGWTATAGTLKSATLEFEMNVDPTDTNGYVAVKAAFVANSAISNVKVLDASGGDGFSGNFEVFGFNLEQPLEDIQKVAVSMKPTGALTAEPAGSGS
jgi:hypothetical protein